AVQCPSVYRPCGRTERGKDRLGLLGVARDRNGRRREPLQPRSVARTRDIGRGVRPDLRPGEVLAARPGLAGGIHDRNLRVAQARDGTARVPLQDAQAPADSPREGIANQAAPGALRTRLDLVSQGGLRAWLRAEL